MHDNVPEYIEKGLKNQLAKCNIKDCHTPTYSRQSNGICESFNGTFKEDYVHENYLHNPEIVRGNYRNGLMIIIVMFLILL